VLFRSIRWLAIIDADEYILPKTTFTMTELLQQHEDKDAIAINWVMFGTNKYNNKQNGLVVNNFIRCENKQGSHVKTISKVSRVDFFDNPHYPVLKKNYKISDIKGNVLDSKRPAFNDNYTADIVQINHYTFKSLEECNKKHYRGNADSETARRQLCNESIHYLYNDIVDDYLPNKYAGLILEYIRMVAVNNDIYRALNPDLRSYSDDQCYEHLIHSSINEKRMMHIREKFPDFNRDEYRNNNPQFQHLNDLELELKYIYSQE
jgi:hypothetical protein